MAAPFCLKSAEQLTGRDIMVKVDNRPDGDDRQSILKMTLINKRGKKRVRIVRDYAKDYGKDTKTLIYFQEPADVRGTAYLSFNYDNPAKDDDNWLYLPALRKVRRITASTKNEYFMGTDFTYDDLGDRTVDEDHHKLLKEETLDGHDCWVIESVPVDESDMYSKRISWIRKDALYYIKVDFYNRQGNLMKTLTVPDMKMHEGFWTAFKMVMDNFQENHKTILEWTEFHYNQDIADSLFRVSTLQRGRII